MGNSGVWGGGLFFQSVDRRVRVRANQITDNFSQDLAAGLYAWQWRRPGHRTQSVCSQRLDATTESSTSRSRRRWWWATRSSTTAGTPRSRSARLASKPPAAFRANIIAGQSGNAWTWYSSSADTVNCNVYWSTGSVTLPHVRPESRRNARSAVLRQRHALSPSAHFALQPRPERRMWSHRRFWHLHGSPVPDRLSPDDGRRHGPAAAGDHQLPDNAGFSRSRLLASDVFALSEGFRDSLSAGVPLDGLAAIHTTLSPTRRCEAAPTRSSSPFCPAMNRGTRWPPSG